MLYPLLHQPPDLTHKTLRLFCLGGGQMPGAVGKMCDLVNVVTDGGQLTGKVFIAVRRARMDLAAL